MPKCCSVKPRKPLDLCGVQLCCCQGQVFSCVDGLHILYWPIAHLCPSLFIFLAHHSVGLNPAPMHLCPTTHVQGQLFHFGWWMAMCALGYTAMGSRFNFNWLTLADGCFPFGAWEVLIASCEGYTSGCFCAQGKGMPCHSLSSSSCCLAVGGIGMEPCRHSGICWPWQAAWVSPVTSFCFIYGAHSPPPYQSVAVLSQGKPFDLCGVQLCCCQGQVFSFVAPWTCLGVHSHGRYRVHFFVHHHPVTN